MPFSIELDFDTGVVHARLCGALESAGAWQAIAAVRRLIASHPVDAVLLDLRDLERTPALTNVERAAAKFVGLLGRRRLAIVIRYLSHYRVAQRLACEAERHDVDVQVFHCEQDARSWVDSTCEH